MKCALFAGSFDPPTNGHLDILERASSLFDEVVAAVAVNPAKNPVLSPAEREDLLRDVTSHLSNVRVTSFQGLAVDLAKREKCDVMIRGIRTLTDFEYEYAMAATNRKIGNIETLFLVSAEEYTFISSRLIREAAAFGADISKFVPSAVVPVFLRKARPHPPGS